MEIDTIKCRRAGLEQNQEPLPRFAPIDQIREIENCVLGDYNFVDKKIDIVDIAGYCKHVPYTGPRWYWKGSCKYMLSQGTITWNDIKYTLIATTHVAHDFFRHIFQTLQDTLINVRTQQLDGVACEDLAKECINSLLGLWSKPTHYTYTCETVTHTEDLTRSGHALKRQVEGHPTLHDYIFETELLTYTSMRPIHQVVLDMEHVYLATMYRTARRYCEPRDISAFLTDALVCHPSNVQRKKLEVAVLALKHADGTQMFRLKHSRNVVVCASTPPITQTFELSTRVPTWIDYFMDDATGEARAIIMRGESVCLQGFGGTGRTFAAKAIARELLDQKRSVVCTSYTHMASQNIAVPGAFNGTLHHCLHKHPTFNGHIVIDEVSQIPLVLWAAILKWSLAGAKFIMLGDFRSQFGPALNRWRTQPVSGNVEDAPFFIRLCDNNRVNFTQYRRGDNLPFFRFYVGLIGQCPKSCVRTLLKKFQYKNDVPAWSLTVSNAQRRALNKAINDDLYNKHGGVYVEAAHQLDNQGFWLIPGCHVVGCATDYGIYNGQLYTILDTRPNAVCLQVYCADETLELSLCHIRCIKPAHSLCYYSCQGRTLRGRVRLYVQHNKITTTHLIVGLSRSTDPTLVDCV